MRIHEPRPLARSRRVRRAAVLVALALVGSAGAAQAAEPGIPADIQVPEGNKLYLEAYATGVQIYDCVAIGDGYGWGPATPRADLYADNGKLFGTHYAGPTWAARDGSKVIAKRDKGVIMDQTAIPWLRLSKVSTAVGADGDRLAGTTFIQRINTTGGLPPAAADCNAATAGSRQEIDYTATYRFWKLSDA